MAANVAAVRFVFPNQENGYVGYRELDVHGVVAPVPEPASLAALTLGGLALLGRRRRSA